MLKLPPHKLLNTKLKYDLEVALLEATNIEDYKTRYIQAHNDFIEGLAELYTQKEEERLQKEAEKEAKKLLTTKDPAKTKMAQALLDTMTTTAYYDDAIIPPLPIEDQSPTNITKDANILYNAFQNIHLVGALLYYKYNMADKPQLVGATIAELTKINKHTQSKINNAIKGTTAFDTSLSDSIFKYYSINATKIKELLNV